MGPGRSVHPFFQPPSLTPSSPPPLPSSSSPPSLFPTPIPLPSLRHIPSSTTPSSPASLYPLSQPSGHPHLPHSPVLLHPLFIPKSNLHPLLNLLHYPHLQPLFQSLGTTFYTTSEPSPSLPPTPSLASNKLPPSSCLHPIPHPL